MILLISLIVDFSLLLTGLVKRRGKLKICRLAAISVLVNMSAFYLSEGLAAEFGNAVFTEAVCAAAAKIFMVWAYVWGTLSKEAQKIGEPDEIGEMLQGYLLVAAVSFCVHSSPAAGLFCELFLLLYLLYFERCRERKQEQETGKYVGSSPGGNSLYLQAIEDSYRKNRALMHDLNNHAIAMHALAVNGEYDELVEYIDTFSQKVKDNMFPVHSGNIVLDALLADKYHQAVRQGILVLFDSVRYSANMGNEDLCTVVGNLFDNAIEENMKCREAGQRRISISLVSDEDSLHLTVRNPLFHELKVKNGLPASEKPDAEHHGIGLRNVRRVCDKYGGTLVWDVSEKEFSVTVELQHFLSECG